MALTREAMLPERRDDHTRGGEEKPHSEALAVHESLKRGVLDSSFVVENEREKATCSDEKTPCTASCFTRTENSPVGHLRLLTGFCSGRFRFVRRISPVSPRGGKTAMPYLDIRAAPCSVWYSSRNRRPLGRSATFLSFMLSPAVGDGSERSRCLTSWSGSKAAMEALLHGSLATPERQRYSKTPITTTNTAMTTSKASATRVGVIAFRRPTGQIPLCEHARLSVNSILMVSLDIGTSRFAKIVSKVLNRGIGSRSSLRNRTATCGARRPCLARQSDVAAVAPSDLPKARNGSISRTLVQKICTKTERIVVSSTGTTDARRKSRSVRM